MVFDLSFLALLLTFIMAPADKLNPSPVESTGVKTPADVVATGTPSTAPMPAGAVEGNPAQAAGTAWTLRYRFEHGQQLRYQSEQKMTLEAHVGENRRIDVSQVRQVRLFTVKTVDPSGTGALAMQFEKVWMQRQVDDQAPVEFDSTMKASDIPEVYRGVAHSLRGNAPTFHLTSTGKAVQEPTLKGAASQVQPAVVESPVEPENPDQKAIQPASATTVESTKSKDPGSFLMLLPENPVRPGDSWKEEFPLTVRGSQELNLQVVVLRTYRLESVTGDIATVTFRSSVRTPIRSSAVRSQLIQATPSGQFQLDMKRGLMISREYRYSETVIGALGAESLLTSVGNQKETLLETASVAP
jgi:hypothetical protein